jgi:hypothetical protein
VDGQMNRALAAADYSSDFGMLLRIGELLHIMRQGFILAASERGLAVYEGSEWDLDLPELQRLLREGRVRVSVEWLNEHKKFKNNSND